MKKLIPVIALMLVFQTGQSQNPNLDYKFAVKLYNLTTYSESSISRNDTTVIPSFLESSNLQILHPTFAFQWKTKKNNFHEIELTNLALGVVKNGTENDTTGDGEIMGKSKLVTTSISMRYEYILNLNKIADNKLVPSVGFAANPYYSMANYKPGVTNLFPASVINLGLKIFVIPRVTYYFSPRFFFDLDVPLCFFDTYLQSVKSDDPTLPIPERTITTITIDAFPKLFCQLRIGFGLKF
jgi:hypothetical protein